MSARGSSVNKKMRVTASPPAGALARGGRSPPLGKRSARPPTSAHCGKNLRWTTIALARKMSADGERLSLHVADEVAAEAAAEALAASPGRDVAAIERNTRRRVYDALKVMVAVGAIARSGKSLRWVGVAGLRAAGKPPSSPAGRAAPLARARAGARKAHAVLLGKRRRAHELAGQLAAFEDHRKARRAMNGKKGGGAGLQVRFPFVLIAARGLPEAGVGDDHGKVQLRFERPFGLFAETDIVTLLATKNPSRARRPRSSRQGAAKVVSPVNTETKTKVVKTELVKTELELATHSRVEADGDGGSCKPTALPFPTSPTTARKAKHVTGNEENQHPNLHHPHVKTESGVESMPVMSLVDGQALGLPVLDGDVTDDEKSISSDVEDDMTSLLCVNPPNFQS